MAEAAERRFWAKVALPDANGCMLWLASCKPNGYAQFSMGGRMIYAHRFSYELAYGRIPQGLHVDHVRAKGCRHRHCVAPGHLELVTQAENNRRSGAGARQRAKTHCPQGHPYAGVNLAIYGGRRNCRQCRKARRRKVGVIHG